MPVSIIVAMDSNGGIGYEGSLPWHIPSDLKRFKRLTTNKTVIMGRKTFESIGRALPGRKNVVLTKDRNFSRENVTTITDFNLFIANLNQELEYMVIGGSQVYGLFMMLATKLYVTRVEGTFKVDTYFPRHWHLMGWKLEEEEEEEEGEGERCSYKNYKRIY